MIKLHHKQHDIAKTKCVDFVVRVRTNLLIIQQHEQI